MDLLLSEEERLIRDTASRFVAQELIAREGAFLKQKEPFVPPGDPARRTLDEAIEKSLIEKAKGIGLWALELPEGAGGSSVGHVARILIYREFGRTALPFEPPSIPAAVAATPYARALASGELSIALAFDETHKTGDLSAVRAAYRSGSGGYDLDSNGMDVICPDADLYLLPALEHESGGLGLFLLERGAAGVRVDSAADLNNDKVVARLTLSACAVPGESRVGGSAEAQAVIASEQLRIAARSLGMAMRCLEASLEHARNRVTFGRPLSSRQAIQWMLADLAVDLRTSTWLTLEAAWKADRDMPYFPDAALAKKRAARMAFEAADIAIQIHGGYGVAKEFPFESFYREARMMRLLYGREAEIDRKIGERFADSGL
ncbi:MAG TPA: acyl-CoA dehydrogenase family protein [Verrucomicrobiae bacterium]|nr:acyl-CoA dehydrogenase family protein [Verrucomicrobiae bacterium]